MIGNNLKIKSLVNDVKSKISDSELFSSGAMKSHLGNIATTVAERYKRRIRVQTEYNPNDEFVAATDNGTICINAGNSLVTVQNDRYDKYMAVLGLLAHEIGHCLFTDFQAGNELNSALTRGSWYPSIPSAASELEQNNFDKLHIIFMNESKRQCLCTLLQHLNNIVEDGYVENRIFEAYPGSFTYGLGLVRDTTYDQTPTISDMLDNGADDFKVMLQMILTYVRFGEVKDGGYDGELIDRFCLCISDIDAARIDRNPLHRMDAVNRILLKIWDLFKIPEDSDQANQQMQQQTNGISGQTQQPTGNTKPVANKSQSNSENQGSAQSPVQKKANATKKRIINIIKQDDSQKSGSDSSGANNASNNIGKKASASKSPESSDNGNSAGNTQGKSGEKAAGGRSGDSGSDNECSDESGSEQSDANGNESGESDAISNGDTEEAGGENSGSDSIIASSEEETGRILYHETDGIDNGNDDVDSGNDKDTEYEGEDNPFAASEIETLLQKIAEGKVNNELETQRASQLNAEAKSIDYGNYHRNIGITVHRRASINERNIESYKKVAPQLIAISKRLQKSILQKLKDKRAGGKESGLLFGRRLETRNLYRNDGKVFYKNRLPEDTPRLAVSVLIDQSGSMSSNFRSVNARAAAVILYDFCKALDIPVSIYGHCCCNYRHVDLYSYAEFDSIDRNDKYRLMDIDAQNACNRDGAALLFALTRLAKRDEEAKLLILISDGQPNDTGYSGSAAEADLRAIKQKCEHKKVTLITAAIGDDKDVIERIYGNSYLNISDVSKLPVELTKLVLRNLKV